MVSHTSVAVHRHTAAQQFGQNSQQAVAAAVVAVAVVVVVAVLLRKAAVHLVPRRGLKMAECSLGLNLV